MSLTRTCAAVVHPTHHRRPPDSTPSCPTASRGSVVPVLAVSLLLAALLAAGLVQTAAAVSRATAAQAAADAAALAGAEDGRAGAARAAQANGARLVSFVSDHLDVEVTVSRRGHVATARARWLPAWVPDDLRTWQPKRVGAPRSDP